MTGDQFQFLEDQPQSIPLHWTGSISWPSYGNNLYQNEDQIGFNQALQLPYQKIKNALDKPKSETFSDGKESTPRPILNRLFLVLPEADSGLSERQECRVYYARVSQTETDVPGENGPRSFWRLEGFSQDWFDTNHPPVGEPTWSDPEQFISYYSEAPIFLMELEVVPDQLRRFAAFGLINDFAERDSEPTEWFRVTAGGQRRGLDADEIVPLTVFPSLNQDGIALTLADIQLVDERTREQLDRAVSTGHIADAEIEDLQKILQPVSSGIDWAVVYDVGQGNSIGLCDTHGWVRSYFDLGGGMGPNLFTFPPALGSFCFSCQPTVILSHWDADHWCSATHPRGREALSNHWIVPRQVLTPAHVALLADIAGAGGKVWFLPSNFAGRWFGQTHLELCTGPGRNHSGIALTISAQPNGAGQQILMPGDADYQYIPSFTGGSQYLSVVAPHHGGKGKGSIPPTCPGAPASRLVYSHGPGNTYGHPHIDTRHDHDANGWNDPTLGKPLPCEVRETANRSTNGLGHVLLGWKPHTAAPPVPCRGSGCQLEAQHL